MKQITTSKGTFIFVEVPDGICHTDLVYYGTMPAIEFRVIATQNIGHAELPKGGNYRFICTTSNADEVHAAMVVEEMGYINGNVGYKSYHKEIEAICPSALFSLLSLIDGSGISIDNNYAILKQI